jgi:integrase
MTRLANRLTDARVRTSTKRGREPDGAGLYLLVGKGGGKSWIFMFTLAGKRREMGLGPYPAISLAKARLKAAECRTAIAEGRDPLEEKKRDAVPTFSAAAEQCIASLEKGWRNAHHRRQWRQTIAEYCGPIASKSVNEIDTSDILRVLQPLWQSRYATSSRVRGRIEKILAYSKARGWRSGENPAVWRNHLDSLLPKRQRLTRGHLRAMPYDEVGGFLATVRGIDTISARALELILLTAVRRNEGLGARWSEIDLAKALWTIPKERTKSGKEHTVPLSRQALAVLAELHAIEHSPFVFPGRPASKQLSGEALRSLLQRLKFKYTLHGFRSSFSDFCGDLTNFPREVAEQALGHTVGDETERAYRRSSGLQKRAELMQVWADYLEGEEAKVIPLYRATLR